MFDTLTHHHQMKDGKAKAPISSALAPALGNPRDAWSKLLDTVLPEAACSSCWDTTVQVLRMFSGHTSGVYSVAFSPDSKTALSGSDDKTLRLWHIDAVPDLIAFIRANRYVPELPCAQRALYDVPPLCSEAQPTATAQS